MRFPFRRTTDAVGAERDGIPLSFDDWANLLYSFNYQGLNYTLPAAPQETIGGDFVAMSRLAYRQNGVVFACMAVRMHVFSDARLCFRSVNNGRPGKLFGTKQLAPLEQPWRAATTRDLMAKALMYADLAGNAYIVRRPGGPAGTRYILLRPDWVTIVGGQQDPDSESDFGLWDVDADVLGYVYHPGGRGSGRNPVTFLADEVAHFAPNPDPEARFRGMSWITPVLREVMADKATTAHKLAFFENGATVNLAVKLDTTDLEKYKQWVELFKENHAGATNAYKTLFLAAGADATPLGANLQQADLKGVQGGMETRIAAAAETPPILVGLSEGLASATYSNYLLARRRFADGTMRPLWGNFCESLGQIVDLPNDAKLWYDESEVAFLREDQKDIAQITALNAVTIQQLVSAGYEPDAVIEALVSNDLSKLEGSHTGLYSVQLQPPGQGTNPSSDTPVPDEADTTPPPAQSGDTGSGRALKHVRDILALGSGPGDSE